MEKIFQIAFWLKSPNEAAVKRMVSGLIAMNLVGTPTGQETGSII